MPTADLNTAFVTYREIIGQPDAWRATLDDLDAQLEPIRQMAARVDRVLFVGCGSPYYLAQSAAAWCRQVTGLPAEAHPASSLWHFPKMTLSRGENTLLVLISRSGETTEIFKAIEQFNQHTGGLIAAVTCFEESALAQRIPNTILTREAREIGLAQTRSFTSMLLAVQGIIFALAGRAWSAEARGIDRLGRALIDQYHALARRLGANLQFDRFFFLSSQPFYGLASEAMLKMKEMSLTASEAYHFMEFRHGPKAMVNANTLVMGFLSQAASDYEAAVLREMRALGGTTIAITPVGLSADAADYEVQIPGDLDDDERGALYLPFLHLMAYYRTVAKGLDPDKPLNLSMVVNLDHENGA